MEPVTGAMDCHALAIKPNIVPMEVPTCRHSPVNLLLGRPKGQRGLDPEAEGRVPVPYQIRQQQQGNIRLIPHANRMKGLEFNC